MTAKISIVVPFYGVEQYLEECLDSLARQSLADLEVIMVDDGSPDNSAVIAKSYADRDARFTLVQQENQGLGPARNTGARHASGEFLAFVDGDDVVPRLAYELLVGSLEETGSDIASGAVRRFDSFGLRPSPMHEAIFRGKPLKRTHISEAPKLLADRTAWNKVYRGSFWRAHGFLFPPGLYEDIPVTLPAHVHAKSVDVLSEVVYLWREREGQDRSITQRRTEPGHLEDRVRVMLGVADFLGVNAPELRRRYLISVLADELLLYVDVAALGDDAYREDLLDWANKVLAEADEEMLDELVAVKRLKYHLLTRRMMPELLDVLDFQRRGLARARVHRKGWLNRRRWYLDLPFYGDATRQIPSRVYDATTELKIVAKIDDVHLREGRFVVEGHAYIGRVDLPDPGIGQIEVWLRETKSGTELKLPVTRVNRPDVTAFAHWSGATYNGSGFVVEVDPETLKAGSWRTATWEVHAQVTIDGLTRKKRLTVGAEQRPVWSAAREVDEFTSIRAVAESSKTFGFVVRRAKAVVTRLSMDGDDALLVEGRIRGTISAVNSLVATSDLVVLSGKITLAESGSGFSARLPLSPLLAEGLEEGTTWALGLLAEDDSAVRLFAAPGLVQPRRALAGRELLCELSGRGEVHLVDRRVQPVITQLAWETGGRLVMRGHLSDPAVRADRFVLRRRGFTEERDVPVAWQEGRFTAVLGPDPDRPMASGNWDLLGPGGHPLLMEPEAVHELPGIQLVGSHDIVVRATWGRAVTLRISPHLADDERGAYAQARLRTENYRRHREEPVRPLAVFDAFEGRQYSCNPRAVFEELRGRNTSLDCVWVSRDGQFAAPEGARVVMAETREHYQVLAQARYIVGNSGQFRWFSKRKGQTYVQCWHGTPLKRLGYDVETTMQRKRVNDEWMNREVPQWDLLVSPNPFTTDIMRRAYRYDGEILESGYPRNDVLKRPDAEERAAEIRDRLGIPEGKKVVLYAPTWRDDLKQGKGGQAFSLELDLERARAELGDDHVLLMRTHYLVTDRKWAAHGDFVLDVSGHSDIAELYLVADVLVTDYSSAMFDFAGTGRPIVVFAYDLEHYRDSVRGFYFDLEAEAPGPVVRTTAEVIDALRGIDALAADHARAYAAFTAKYCPFDDGHAAARVVDRVFGGEVSR